MRKQIIILTKSSKHNNYCIAGIDCKTREWIRLVSNDEDTEGAALRKDVTYSDGTEVEVLDIVDVELIKPIPTIAQRENWLYDSKFTWNRIGRTTIQDVLRQRGEDNCGDNIFGNIDNKIASTNVTGQSLALIRADSPSIIVKTFERKKVSFLFTYNRINYKFFSVRDIPLYLSYKDRDDGTYKDLGNMRYAVVSLTGIYKDGMHYKMLAQLF